MTGLISRTKKTRAIWMAAGGVILLIILLTSTVDNHKTVAAETKKAIASIRVAAADDRGHSANDAKSRQIAVPFSADEEKLMIGDRLKVSVYERLGSGTDSSSALALSSMVEHTEMSGEYTVQTDGGIFLPFIGRMDAAGVTSNALQHALESKIATVFKGHAVSSVRLQQREPIYVTGSVTQPGTFNYTPGMMVLNAVILAGTTANQGNGQNLELMRMKEHLQQADVKLATLLAERDVLIAMRDEQTPKASRTLLNLAGESQVANLIASATKLAELKEKRFNNELHALAADRDMLEKQRNILTNGLEDALAAFNHTKERMSAVLKLRRTGVTTDSTYYQAIGDLDISQGKLNDLKSALAKLEAQIVAVDEQEKKIVVDMKIAREQAISDLHTSIADAAVTRDTLRPTMALGASNDQRAETAHYTILRRTSEGMEKIEANRFSLLRPGDIVEIVQTVRPFLDANAVSEK